MKTIVLILMLLLSNCSTSEKITKYNPSFNVGCSKIVESKDRLLCISKMIKQLEDIRNSKIIIVEKKKIERVDQRYSLFNTTFNAVPLPNLIPVNVGSNCVVIACDGYS